MRNAEWGMGIEDYHGEFKIFAFTRFNVTSQNPSGLPKN
jgi:hypothetical protein